LIGLGHSYRDAIDYTPRQMLAFLWMGEQRRRREKADTLSLNAMASRGKPQDLKKLQKDLAKEA